MHRAACTSDPKKRQKRVLAHLKKNPTDIESIISDTSQERIMHIAALENDVPLGQLLLAFRPNLNAQTSFGWTPLIAAASNSSLQFIDLLLAASPLPDLCLTDRSDQTALMHLSRCRIARPPKPLLSIDANSPSSSSGTPNPSLTPSPSSTITLSSSSSSSPSSAQPSSPVQSPKRSKPSSLSASKVKPFLSTSAKHSTSSSALPSLEQLDQKPLYVRVLRLLLSHMTAEQINRVSSTGDSALHVALSKGNKAALRLLLAHGADPNLRKNGLSPLLAALQARDHALSALLLDYGADPDLACPSLGTPRALALQQNDYGACALFAAAASRGGALAFSAAQDSQVCLYAPARLQQTLRAALEALLPGHSVAVCAYPAPSHRNHHHHHHHHHNSSSSSSSNTNTNTNHDNPLNTSQQNESKQFRTVFYLPDLPSSVAAPQSSEDDLKAHAGFLRKMTEELYQLPVAACQVGAEGRHKVESFVFLHVPSQTSTVFPQALQSARAAFFASLGLPYFQVPLKDIVLLDDPQPQHIQKFTQRLARYLRYTIPASIP